MRRYVCLYLLLPVITVLPALCWISLHKEHLMGGRDMNARHHYKPRDFEFAQPLVTLRKRAGLTQKAVALQLGVGEKSIRNWEGGNCYPSEAHLRQLIEIYLSKHAFTPEHEQEEVHKLWDQLGERTSHHTSSFDEQWFAALLQKVRTKRSSRFPRGDRGEMLDVSAFYGRTDEFAELEQWLLVDQCRLIAVLGMSGIGKTTLVARLAQQITPLFDCVLWCSLQNAPSLETLLLDWLPTLAEQGHMSFPPGVDRSLPLLMKFLQERRCLLVLDNLETLLLERHYREGYEAYALLIRQVAESRHRSCLVLTCREKFPDQALLTGKQAPGRVLRLGGLTPLASQQMLQGKELFGDQEAWSKLVQWYAGNPLALKIVAEMVHELFGGDIAAFLAEGFTTFYEIRQLLAQQFERLTPVERALMYRLAIAREQTALSDLSAGLRYPITKGEVMEAMHSLRSRSLVERGENGVVFMLQPVILEYITNLLIAQVSEEICSSKPALLLTHALLQAQAKEYIRTSQARLLLQPMLARLVSHFGARQSLEAQLERLLQQLRALPQAKQGYGGGNIVNLLVHLNGHVKGKDCSRLTIWQADLQGAEAQEATFVESDLTGSIFNETINSIISVAISPNGQCMAGGTNTGEIRLWRVDGLPLLALVGHPPLVWSLAFNPESTLLVSGGYDGLVKIWEVSSGQCIHTLRGHTKWIRSVAIHPAGVLLATGDQDGLIRLWDIVDGQCLKEWLEPGREVWSLAFSSDGRRLASGDANGVIKLWDLIDKQYIWNAIGGSAITSLVFSQDSELLVSAGVDARIIAWHTSNGKRHSTLSGHTGAVRSLTANKEGLLASSSFDGTVKLWQVDKIEAGQCLGTLYGHTHWVWSAAFGPDGLLVSGSHDGTVKLWQIGKEGGKGECLRTLRGYARRVTSVAFSPDGKMLVSGESNGMVKLWETESGQCLRVLSTQAGGFMAVAFSPDGQLVASSLPDKTIKLWVAGSGQCLRTLEGHEDVIWSVVFSSDGRFLLSSSADLTIKRWEINSGQCLTTFQGQNHWIWSVTNSPDGKLLASGDFSGAVKVWDIGSGQCLHTLQSSSQAIVALMFTPDGTRLLSSNAQDLVAIWDVNSGQCLKTVSGMRDAYWLCSIAFSVDGSLLVTANSDQTVKVWDVSSGTLLHTLPCHTSRPCSVIFTVDQRLLASGMEDGTILVWEKQTGQCFRTLRGDRPYERMNISGVTGITEAQKASLKALGAIERFCDTPHA